MYPKCFRGICFIRWTRWALSSVSGNSIEIARISYSICYLVCYVYTLIYPLSISTQFIAKALDRVPDFIDKIPGPLIDLVFLMITNCECGNDSVDKLKSREKDDMFSFTIIFQVILIFSGCNNFWQCFKGKRLNEHINSKRYTSGTYDTQQAVLST